LRRSLIRRSLSGVVSAVSTDIAYRNSSTFDNEIFYDVQPVICNVRKTYGIFVTTALQKECLIMVEVLRLSLWIIWATRGTSCRC